MKKKFSFQTFNLERQNICAIGTRSCVDLKLGYVYAVRVNYTPIRVLI